MEFRPKVTNDLCSYNGGFSKVIVQCNDVDENISCIVRSITKSSQLNHENMQG